MPFTCGIYEAVLNGWTSWRRRTSRNAEAVEAHNLQDLQGNSTVQTATSPTTPPTSRTRSGSGNGIVAAPSLAELQRTAQVKPSAKFTQYPTHPAIRPLRAETSTSLSRIRHTPTAATQPADTTTKPLPLIPRSPPKLLPQTAPPPVNPAYAASRAARTAVALAQGQTSTDILLRPDSDDGEEPEINILDALLEDDFSIQQEHGNHNSILPRPPSPASLIRRRTSVLRRPPGPRIAALPGQDKGWEALGLAPSQGTPVTAVAMRQAQIENASNNTDSRGRVQAWTGQDGQARLGAPERLARRASLEWAIRQEKFRRRVAEARQVPGDESETVKRASFSDWEPEESVQSIAGSLPLVIEESGGGQVAAEEGKEGLVFLQPTVYTPSPLKGKGKAAEGGEGEGEGGKPPKDVTSVSTRDEEVSCSADAATLAVVTPATSFGGGTLCNRLWATQGKANNPEAESGRE
ncbi:MAG: hypothetical protein M1822_009505 [Bathelium mastoideum]|nr:MAG: hypothetical protein M1822_009505 [Bathelium mastoideum]